jgi:hypothetical protein
MAPADDKSKEPVPPGGLDPTPEEVDSLKTTRNYVIGAFVLLTVAGQVLVARRNASHLKEVAKRTGVKFEAPKRSAKEKDDDWW